jgi:predicted Zn-dependent protease
MRLHSHSLLTAAAATVLVAGCATNPVTGKRQLSLISEEDEIALGQQSKEQIVQQMGAYPDPKLQAYVESIGKRMAAQSERPNLPWSFTVIDDPVVNAFALPGGPIFVTRGILTHLNSEAELASVLGHEIGHVTARHSVDQMSKAQLAQLGLGVGMILKPELAGVGQAAAAGFQLMFLKFGRDAEKQSDDLGFKYMVAQGYDPREADDMFVTLKRSSEIAGGGGRVPEWASTHPDPENRAEAARKRAESVPGVEKLKVDRENYLAHLGGLVFGDNPRQGYFQGNAFLHPELKFRLEFPEGWKTQNTASAVVAVSPKDDAAIQLVPAGTMSPQEAAQKFLSQEGVKPAQLQSGQGGLPAGASYFEAQTQQGVVRGIASFLSHSGQTFGILSFTGAEALPGYDAVFRKTMASFQPLTDPAALAVQPAKVELVKVPRQMTAAEFNSQFPSTVPVEQVAIMNGLDPAGGTFQAGQTAKRVVGGVPAPSATAKP